MTVLSALSPAKNSPPKASVKRTISKPRQGSEKRRRQVDAWTSITLQRPKKPVGEPWPLHDLRAFDAPAQDESEINHGPLLIEVLKARGWRYSTNPCHGTFDKNKGSTFWVQEFEASLRGQKPEKVFGKDGIVQGGYRLQAVPLPKHALWMMGRLPYRVPGTDCNRVREREDFVKIVVEHGHNLSGKPGNYRMAKFPGTETLLFKTHLTEAFQDKPWYPVTYILPKDKTSFLKEIESRGNSKNNLWIGKPRNDYGGSGIRVYKGTDQELVKAVQQSDKEPRSLIQHYIADPHLIGGYKYHMRIHLVITNLCPLEAFVQENGQCLFATKPYTLSSKTMGASFDPPVHVTNMGLNTKPENKENFFLKKPVVGRGQQIRMRQLVSHLAETCPSFSKQALWQQILNIAADTARYIGQGVQRNSKPLHDRHFEIFGMDLMLDKDMKVWMCEVNTDPGLSYPDKEVLGSPNPDYQKELQACKDTFHDLFALLGLDAGREQQQGSLRSWFELDFSQHQASSKLAAQMGA
jgi:hypothetical protein